MKLLNLLVRELSRHEQSSIGRTLAFSRDEIRKQKWDEKDEAEDVYSGTDQAHTLWAIKRNEASVYWTQPVQPR